MTTHDPVPADGAHESRWLSVGHRIDRMLSDRRIHPVVIVLWWWLGWHFLAGQTL